jgi:hypothetical protein
MRYVWSRHTIQYASPKPKPESLSAFEEVAGPVAGPPTNVLKN